MLKRQLGSPVTHRRGLGRLGPLSPLLDLALATAFAITARHCPEARGPKRPKQLSPDRKGPESPSPVSLPLLEPSRSRKETCTTAVAESTCLWACNFRSQARAEAKEAKRKRCPVPTLFGAIKESRNGTRARKLGSQHRSHWACDLRLTEQQEWPSFDSSSSSNSSSSTSSSSSSSSSSSGSSGSVSSSSSSRSGKSTSRSRI